MFTAGSQLEFGVLPRYRLKSTALSGKRPGSKSLVHHARDGMCCSCPPTRVDRALHALVRTDPDVYEPASRRPFMRALHARVRNSTSESTVHHFTTVWPHWYELQLAVIPCCAWKKLISQYIYVLIVFYAASVRSLRLKPVIDNVSDSATLSSRTHALAHFDYVLEEINTISV